ncbi:hypothetical protein BGV40_03390 [Methanosarcina sp. Ant1]|nr:hypothetical protein BGV40_03390 [Methanosarcina sp. Ant1]
MEILPFFPSVYSIPDNYRYDRPDLSIIIPVHNEAENIVELYEKLKSTLSILEITYEIIFVDDGSTDDTFKEINAIRDNRIKIVRFQRNYGKAAALSCKFSKSRGKVVIIMDGDLQDDPKKIQNFLKNWMNSIWFLDGKAKDMILSQRPFSRYRGPICLSGIDRRNDHKLQKQRRLHHKV